MTATFVLTRRAALDRLAEVAPRTGRTYAAHRNTDAGPHADPTTTALSPYLRRRLLLEQEAIEAALAAHGPGQAAKFIEEVFWRSYFKGFLETHPAAWTNYKAALAQQDPYLPASTGIECFDEWTRELVETGWLHNHTRMWFASIWIFTLRLPWELGADFFLRHLIDGDPASNTLSWRWVAGLHTRGKPYAARAENIRRYTDGRFAPTGLNENPVPLEEVTPPPTIPLPAPDPAPSGEIALLLHLDDLHPESLPLHGAKVTRIGALLAHTQGASTMVQHADREAMADTLTRAAAWFGCDAGPATPGWHADLPIVTAWAPVGPSADALPPNCKRVRRHWDDLTWPRSTTGYFKLKTTIPTVLRTVLDPP